MGNYLPKLTPRLDVVAAATGCIRSRLADFANDSRRTVGDLTGVTSLYCRLLVELRLSNSSSQLSNLLELQLQLPYPEGEP